MYMHIGNKSLTRKHTVVVMSIKVNKLRHGFGVYISKLILAHVATL